ncbi:hypothetical protein SARC_00014 [Sphaeroforma arctica JP610]|uniref:Uncharacterized protein n=1 Tax=Sphaeroforma arctica JP610 TaxID=667725 RepID=A0A0L0GFL7_9EUKA|nr:hypothetical protein SARC_00014 [Sphaeroforma arctica JP610]KNC87880.1 hypothetical protein SARC_00014 [Sphaeroforma arctica JP610]|eukprot:XP_014161782.1 hypothetical protein SARC_00014 [Sphaeroforma arctica JP610]
MENSGKWTIKECKSVLKSADLQKEGLGAALACSKPNVRRYLNMLNFSARTLLDPDSMRDSSDLARAALATVEDA